MSRESASSPAGRWRAGGGALATLVLVYFAVLGGIHQRYQGDVARIQEGFVDEARADARAKLAQVEGALRVLYQSLRTISRLPGVRGIDRHATNFDADARLTLQEIYNNLATNLSVSEVYILPVDFDPHALDPVTGHTEEPIVVFDEFIVGRTAVNSAEEAGDEVPEIEIHEYELMQEQLATLRARYPDEATIHDLEVPMVGGREVITCDNSRYSPRAPDDRDRSGFVYLVPFYGPDGKLRGAVAGITLTLVLADLLGDGAYALVHPGYRLDPVGIRAGGQWQLSAAAVRAARPDPALLYSEVLDVGVPDLGGGWKLWAGRSQELLVASGKLNGPWRAAIATAAACTLAFALVLVMLQRRARDKHQAEVVRQSVVELAELVSRQGTVSESHAEVVRSTRTAAHELTSSQHQVMEVVQGLASTAEQSVAAGRTGAEALDSARERFRRMTERVEETGEILGQLSSCSSRIASIVTLVDEFAEQSKFLALNASIEAARAGEEGRGFAVVATEVRNLALQSQSSTVRINEILAELTRSVAKVMESSQAEREEIRRTEVILNDTQAALAALFEVVETAREASRQTLGGVEEQTRAVEEISRAIDGVDAALTEGRDAVVRIESVSRQLRDELGSA